MTAVQLLLATNDENEKRRKSVALTTNEQVLNGNGFNWEQTNSREVEGGEIKTLNLHLRGNARPQQ